MAKNRFAANVARDRVRAQGAANFDVGGDVMKVVWRQQNAEHLVLVRENLARADLYEGTRTLLLSWEAKLTGNPLHTLTGGRLAFLGRLKVVAKMNAEHPERPRPPQRRRGFGHNPAFEKKRAGWLEDPSLLPKCPPRKPPAP